MKSSIKYADHRCIRHEFLTRCDTQKIRRIMKRCEIYTLFESLYYRLFQQYRMSKFFTCVNYSMAYSTYFAHIFNNAVIFILYCHKDMRDRIFVIIHRNYKLEFFASRFFVCYH